MTTAAKKTFESIIVAPVEGMQRGVYLLKVITCDDSVIANKIIKR